MDFSPILFFSTTVFGYSVTTLILCQTWTFFLHVFAGWIVGSMLSSVILFFYTFIHPMSPILVCFLIVTQASLTVLIIEYLKNKKKKNPTMRTSIRFEESVWFFLILCFAGVLSLTYLNFIYRGSVVDGKIEFSTILKPFLYHEYSFINSLLYGANVERKNFFLFEEPLMAGETMKKSPLPLLFEAACIEIGSNYSSCSTLICFLNTLATAAFLFFFIKRFSRHLFLASVCYFLNSGWSFFRLLFNHNIPKTADLVHDVGKEFNIPNYQTMAFLLSIPKESSFAVPLGLLAIGLVQSSPVKPRPCVLAGFAASLIPIPSVSAAVFAFCLTFPNTFKTVLPFAVSLIPKFINSGFNFNPIWREFQMQGVFLSGIATSFEVFGPALLTFAFFKKWTIPVNRALSSLSITVFFAMFREGKSTIPISSITACMFLPILMAMMHELIETYQHYQTSDKLAGATRFIFFFTLFVYICGGVACMVRTNSSREPLINADDFSVCEKLRNSIPMNETYVVSEENSYFLSFLSGKSVFLDQPTYMYDAGYRVTYRILKQRSILKGNITEEMTKQGLRYIAMKENPDPASFECLFQSNLISVFKLKNVLY